MRVCPRPVSYTHLDVYKRQGKAVRPGGRGGSTWRAPGQATYYNAAARSREEVLRDGAGAEDERQLSELRKVNIGLGLRRNVPPVRVLSF